MKGRARFMGKIIQISNYSIAKDDKMYKEFLSDIRNKTKNIEDMPERAKDALKYFQVTDFSSGVPIVEMLTKLGFKIYQSRLEPENLSAYIAINPQYEDIYGSNKIICVNIKDNIGHKKFALAHELGHYLFDFNEDKNLYYYDTYFAEKGRDNLEESEEKIEEKRANKFAANLLMPEIEFREKYEQFKKLQSKIDIVSALGHYFWVSSTAVLKRFNELGISGYDSMEI